MKYKVLIFCPNDNKVINKIVKAASKNGAGIIGNYSHCYFITLGKGNWKSEEGSHPTIGKVGEFSSIEEVRIEMEYHGDKIIELYQAIKSVHPFEEPVIQFIRLEEI